MPQFNDAPITANGAFDMENTKATQNILDISGDLGAATVKFYRKVAGHTAAILVVTITQDDTSLNWKLSEDITHNKNDGILVLSGLHDTFKLVVSGKDSNTNFVATLNPHSYAR